MTKLNSLGFVCVYVADQCHCTNTYLSWGHCILRVKCCETIIAFHTATQGGIHLHV